VLHTNVSPEKRERGESRDRNERESPPRCLCRRPLQTQPLTARPSKPPLEGGPTTLHREWVTGEKDRVDGREQATTVGGVDCRGFVVGPVTKVVVSKGGGGATFPAARGVGFCPRPQQTRLKPPPQHQTINGLRELPTYLPTFPATRPSTGRDSTEVPRTSVSPEKKERGESRDRKERVLLGACVVTHFKPSHSRLALLRPPLTEGRPTTRRFTVSGRRAKKTGPTDEGKQQPSTLLAALALWLVL
jgi:hypothetical protein